MTTEEMQARIAALEEQLSSKPCRRTRTARKADAETLKRRQFRAEARERRNRHKSGINRYAIYR